MMLKFSILIAHYNNYDFFKDCYQSIKNQSYKKYEIIIVDDHSCSSSYSKIVELTQSDPKVKLFRNESNKGIGFTKNKCAELASGDILGFVDPDDAITPDALEEIIKEYSSEKIVAVYSQFYKCDLNLVTQEIFTPSKQVENGSPLFFNIFFEVNHFFTFRKSAYEITQGINPVLTSAVDQDLYLKIYETGNLKFLKKPLYLYRFHEDGASQQKSKKEILFSNWHKVILETLKRRKICKIYKKINHDIPNLPLFIHKKQNTILTRISRKLKWSIFSLNLLTDLIT